MSQFSRDSLDFKTMSRGPGRLVEMSRFFVCEDHSKICQNRASLE